MFENICRKCEIFISPLYVEGKQINQSHQYVCQFSKELIEKYEDWIQKGYKFQAAYVNYKVKWYDKETEKEYYTILPRISMVKRQ